MNKPKLGDRFVNHLGEYCIVKSIDDDDLIKLQICGPNDREETWKLDHFNNPELNRFMEVPFPKVNRTNIASHLLEYQLNLIGKTTLDAKEEDDWFDNWTITQNNVELFEKYAIPLLQKTFKFSKKKAKETFNWFFLQFGLKEIKNTKI